MARNDRHVPSTAAVSSQELPREQPDAALHSDGDLVVDDSSQSRPPLGFGIVAIAKRMRYKDLSNRRLMHHKELSKQRLTDRRGSQVSTESSPLMSSRASVPEEEVDEETLGEIIWDMIFEMWVSYLLVFAPFALLSHFLEWSPVATFWLNFLTMIPLASILGEFTEEVALHTNEVVGGLVNATFGNAVEVVVAIQALMADEIRVVQASMIGSIFSNLLLVLGSCFFSGGMIYKEQTFNSTAATANMSLLALSSIALVLPTPFAHYYDVNNAQVLQISRFAAIGLMLMYFQLLIFQLKTHAHLFQGEEQTEMARIPFLVSIGGLLLITLLIAVFSEFLVQSIDGFVSASGVSRTFVGLIILPIVGNAVEHLTAISVAMKDKMDLAMGGT